MALHSSDIHAPSHLPIVYGWSQSLTACGQCIAAVLWHLTMNTLMKYSLPNIVTLVRHKKPGSSARCMVRHIKNGSTQNSWFDTKCPAQHASVDFAIITHSPPFLLKLFSNFYQTFCFKEPIHKLKKQIPLSKRCSSRPPCCQGFTMHSTTTW